MYLRYFKAWSDSFSRDNSHPESNFISKILHGDKGQPVFYLTFGLLLILISRAPFPVRKS